jgi:iron complex outermembrane receptor protein
MRQQVRNITLALPLAALLAMVEHSATAAGGTPPASAPVAGTGVATLEEVIVTARKREETLQRVPVAVTAVSAADIEFGRDRAVHTQRELSVRGFQ